QPRLLDVYLQHKNGFRLPVRLKIIPLVNGDGQSVGLAELFTDISPAVTIPLKMAELEKMQLLDLDTGLPNRLYLEMYLKNKIDEYQKYGLPFGLIYADVDNFNKIQERFGRFNSAKLIRMIARTLQKNVRYLDIVGRWENEEFLICLLNIDENRLDIVANKLRLLVAESYITVETGLLNATVSMGATLVQRFDTIESLVKRAEELMLHSKWLGRNKVSLTITQKET
ncbi:MAG TPA: sensor domain-containing diguanylate cyclase, partial [Candidatus Saccharicenans sp.]|nr:sensor domain-containing diguanylate cyclase [Candidatus Saccharicenans sp.]